MNTRRSLLTVASAVAIALAVVLSGVATASASTANAAPVATAATSFQNATISAALENNSSGVRVSTSEVEWKNGAVTMTVPANPDAGVGGCPSGIASGQWTCVYDELSFHGTRLQFQDAGYYQDLRQYGGADWDTLSYSNTRGQRSWLNEYKTGNHGSSYCMTGNSAGSNISGDWSEDQWILLTSNYDAC
jgi:hypothetical protein